MYMWSDLKIDFSYWSKRHKVIVQLKILIILYGAHWFNGNSIGIMCETMWHLSWKKWIQLCWLFNLFVLVHLRFIIMWDINTIDADDSDFECLSIRLPKVREWKWYQIPYLNVRTFLSQHLSCDNNINKYWNIKSYSYTWSNCYEVSVKVDGILIVN